MVHDAVADGGLQDAGCRMQMQVAYKYGSFVYLGKVKKITNLGCSCPSSDFFFREILIEGRML